jgi:hypothetical protein
MERNHRSKIGMNRRIFLGWKKSDLTRMHIFNVKSLLFQMCNH